MNQEGNSTLPPNNQPGKSPLSKKVTQKVHTETDGCSNGSSKTSSARIPSARLATFGWQGISFLHPESWDTTSLSNESNKGDISLDDGIMERIRIHWEIPPSSFSLQKIIDKHIHTLERDAKKKRIPFKVQRKANFTKRNLFKNRNGECFIWVSDYKAYATIWYCKTCGKLFLMRVLSKNGENLREIVENIYGSVQDHPSGEKMIWGIYGLLFHLPQEYTLQEFSLKSGFIRLNFTGKRDYFIIERWGLASSITRNKGFKDWFLEIHPQESKHILQIKESGEKNNHQAIEFAGRRRKRVPFKKEKNILYGKTWLCRESNRIFVILSYQYPKTPSMIEERASAVLCHNEKKTI